MALRLVKNQKVVKAYSLYIYGEITDEQWFEDDITPTMVNTALVEAGDAELIDVYINSPGGSVFAGHTIYNALKRHTSLIRTTVDGIAASIASTILQAGDERAIAPNGMVMIHPASGGVWGTEAEIRSYADALADVTGTVEDTYLDKIDMPREELKKLMDAETYMNAEKAVELGFVDSIVGEKVTIQNKNGELIINSLKINRRNYKNIYKNSAKIKPYEPSPVVDYSLIESVIAENNVTLLESEILSNELE